MRDNLNQIWLRFFTERVQTLWNRFPGWWRAEVVETNDPLQIHRIRFKIPELHDFDLKPEDCPWAIPAPWLGGKNAGSWSHPIIGDIIFITWEKNHPYGPIWCGSADETRRKLYPLESIYTRSPSAVKEDGTAEEAPDDFLEEALPKDHRPMSFGERDRYGNSEVVSSVGFFPKEHDEKPAPLGQDAVAKKRFETATNKPELNNPDRKYWVQTTKYGTYIIASDVGYLWQKPKDGDSPIGEFKGDFDEDRDFEVKRYKYLLKHFNEQEFVSEKKDQRRYEIRTRAGHMFEMRDVGWANEAGGRAGCDDAGQTKSRDGEYGEPRVLAKKTENDERWVKFRTKGGHLIQLMDSGFHPEKDNYYKRLLQEEIGSKTDEEEDADWTKRDARQVRIVTRWGIKLVLDDRGSDPIEAELKEAVRGNGWMLRSRRGWETSGGTARGFAIEANDKNELNTTRWYTPKSKLMEMNDRKDYTLICTDLKGDLAREWMGRKENEFALRIGMTDDPEKNTYHCKLDKANGYVRLKTAAGGDNGLRPQPEAFGSAEAGFNQGFEARDGRFGEDGSWVELVDLVNRGMWLSNKYKLGIWRAADGKDQFVMIDDGKDRIVIRNNQNGPMQLFCAGNVEVISKRNIALKADQKITFKAAQEIAFDAGGGQAKLTKAGWFMNVPDHAPEHRGRLPGAAAGDGAQSPITTAAQVINPQEITQAKRFPADRGAVANGPFTEVEERVIRVCNDN